MADNAPIDDETTDDAPPPGATERARDAGWVRAARSGDRDAFGRLYDAWFDRTFHLVTRIVRDRDTAQEVCQDAFLSAWRGLGDLQDENAFGGWLLRIARNAAYNRSAREARSRPVDDEAFAVIERTHAAPGSAPAGFDVGTRLAATGDPAALVGDAEIAGLVREAAAALGDRDSEVLDLQLRLDLTPGEIGDVIGLNRNAANQLCHRVRVRFATAFRARLLWQGTRPRCQVLAAALATAGIDAFGAEAVALADRHARSCTACEDRRQTAFEPSMLFAAMPVVAAPIALKQQVAAALTAHGVPMDGSAAAGAPADPARPTDSSGVSGRGPDESSRPPEPTGGDAPLGSFAARAASRRNRRVLAAAGATAIAVAALGALVWPRSGSERLVAAGTTTTAPPTVLAAPPPSAGVARTPPAVAAPDGAPGASTPDGATETGPEAPAGPTSTAPAPAVVELLTLDPADPQPTPYPIGPGSPTLRWEVTAATDVKVSMWFDDGASGPRLREVVSTEPSGMLQVCPGPQSEPGSCDAMPGTYSFVVEATGADGVVVTTGAGDAPSFEVYVVIR